ncbi:hypothetical protein PORCRE_2130 [Porphyromonas crevioricanis JCM 15906]|uniref:Uncharacterized protein n=1 Tax=Porphyromonas crevioricanis JCM 15906 TaxID=1305617 RepID=T1CRB6_9PORP|nr:hypothetical protein [Porphyromonas crevioricanis]GAD06397.1 hypothetical protein PORCRE_2130 [Porphyromonas crevioricanis JCM 15906]SJZ63908.1 hypothetical protein SAMN02745203_00436 [Porphyromonas crevioricanis]
MKSDKKTDKLKEKQSVLFLKKGMRKNTLAAFIYALVTAMVGMFIMSSLYDVEINFIYGLILAGWLFLIDFLFLLIKSSLKKRASKTTKI